MQFSNEIHGKHASTTHFFKWDGQCHRRIVEALFDYTELVAFVRGYGDTGKIYKLKSKFSIATTRVYNKQLGYAIGGGFEVIECDKEELADALTQALTEATQSESGLL